MSSTYSAGYQPYANQGAGQQTPALKVSNSTTGSYSSDAAGGYQHTAVSSSSGQVQAQGSTSFSQTVASGYQQSSEGTSGSHAPTQVGANFNQMTTGYQQSPATNNGNQTPTQSTSNYNQQSNSQGTFDYSRQTGGTAFNQNTAGYDSYGAYSSITGYDSTGASSAYNNTFNASGYQGSYGSSSTENTAGAYAAGTYGSEDTSSYNNGSYSNSNSGYNSSNMSGYGNSAYNSSSTGSYDDCSSQYTNSTESGTNNNTTPRNYSSSTNSGYVGSENGNYGNSSVNNNYTNSYNNYDNSGSGYDGYNYYDDYENYNSQNYNGNSSNSNYDSYNGNDYGYSNYSTNSYSVGNTRNQSYNNHYNKNHDRGSHSNYTYTGYTTGISRGFNNSDYSNNNRGVMRGTRGSRSSNGFQKGGRGANAGDSRGFRGRGGNSFNDRGRRGGDSGRMNQGNYHGNTRGRGVNDRQGGMGRGGMGRGGDHRGDTGTQRYGSGRGGITERLTKPDWNKNTQKTVADNKTSNSKKVYSPFETNINAVKRQASPEVDNTELSAVKSMKTEQNTEDKPGPKTSRTDSTSSVKSTDSKEETTPKKKGAGKKDDLELDPEVEAKLALLIQPKFCKLCNLAMNYGLQADQHYDGKNHAKKVRLFRQSAALEVTLKKLEMEGSIVTGKTVVLMDEDGQTEAVKKKEEEDRKEKEESKKSKEDQERLAGASEEIYCKVCDVSFNSPKQAMQHYEGKNHHKKVRMSTQARDVTESQKDHVTVDGTVFECKLCSVHVTCQEQLNAHLDGAKHKSKLKSQERGDWSGGRAGLGYRGRGRGGAWFNGRTGFQDGVGSKRGYPFPGEEADSGQPKRHRDFHNYRTPSGRFYCKVCNVTMSGDGQFAMHMDSKKHKTNNSSFRHIPDVEMEVS